MAGGQRSAPLKPDRATGPAGPVAEEAGVNIEFLAIVAVTAPDPVGSSRLYA
jgi:hypothetical protein